MVLPVGPVRPFDRLRGAQGESPDLEKPNLSAPQEGVHDSRPAPEADCFETPGTRAFAVRLAGGHSRHDVYDASGILPSRLRVMEEGGRMLPDAFDAVAAAIGSSGQELKAVGQPLADSNADRFLHDIATWRMMRSQFGHRPPGTGLAAIAWKFRELRGRMSRKELGHKIRVSPRTIKLVENGEVFPSAEFAVKAARYLNGNLRDLLTSSPPQGESPERLRVDGKAALKEASKRFMGFSGEERKNFVAAVNRRAAALHQALGLTEAQVADAMFVDSNDRQRKEHFLKYPFSSEFLGPWMRWSAAARTPLADLFAVEEPLKDEKAGAILREIVGREKEQSAARLVQLDAGSVSGGRAFAIRLACGLLLDQVARQTGITPRRLWLFEDGKSALTGEEYDKLAQALGSTPAELYQPAGQPLSRPGANLYLEDFRTWQVMRDRHLSLPEEARTESLEVIAANFRCMMEDGSGFSPARRFRVSHYLMSEMLRGKIYPPAELAIRIARASGENLRDLLTPDRAKVEFRAKMESDGRDAPSQYRRKWFGLSQADRKRFAEMVGNRAKAVRLSLGETPGQFAVKAKLTAEQVTGTLENIHAFPTGAESAEKWIRWSVAANISLWNLFEVEKPLTDPKADQTLNDILVWNSGRKQFQADGFEQRAYLAALSKRVGEKCGTMKITPRKLAHDLGLTPAYFTMIAHQSHFMSLETALAVKDALGMTMKELLG